MDLKTLGASALATCIAFAAAGPALAESPRGEGRIVLAQAVARPSNEQRREDQYLDVLKQLRSQCSNAGWTLWRSNSYEAWRNRKSSIMSMHYSSSSYPTLPSAPQAWPEALRTKLEDTLKRANDTLKEAGANFKELANYINAKDYEDDKFKKGDAINAKLLEQGQTCHRIHAELTGLYTEIVEKLIETRTGAAAKPEIVAVMIADWRQARALAAEMAKFEKSDQTKLDGLVRDVSTLVDDRKANFAPLKENPETFLKRFYESILNDDVAVKMRRLLREAKNPKAFKEAAEDRPRSQFWSVRSEIEVAMPDALLRYIASGK